MKVFSKLAFEAQPRGSEFRVKFVPIGSARSSRALTTVLATATLAACSGTATEICAPLTPDYLQGDHP